MELNIHSVWLREDQAEGPLMLPTCGSIDAPIVTCGVYNIVSVDGSTCARHGSILYVTSFRDRPGLIVHLIILPLP